LADITPTPQRLCPIYRRCRKETIFGRAHETFLNMNQTTQAITTTTTAKTIMKVLLSNAMLVPFFAAPA
jgi:hypothetical protein